MARLLALLAVALVPALPAGVAAECRPVDDLGRYTVGNYPDDWKPREERARELYRVLEQGGVRFIRATARSTGLQIAKEFDWDLDAFPVLAWRWRPQLFPHGADEREAGRNDSVLGVYAVFPHSPVAVKTVKYVWSGAAPAGATAEASRGLTKMLVLRSGERAAAPWVEETANVAQDYRRLFGEAPKQPRGIAILTDADDTKGAAVGDYTDFRVCSAGEPRREQGKPAAAIGDPGKPPAPAPAKPVKPAPVKRAEKPRPAVAAGTPRVVVERTPPVDRPPVRYSRPVSALTPPQWLQPEPR